MTGTIGFELSTQQQDRWRRHTTSASSSHVCVLEFERTLDLATLRNRLASATARHEVLRTTFSQPAGRRFPLQVVAEQTDAPPAEERDLRAEPVTPAELERDILTVPFDLEHGPLLRVTLVHLADARQALVLGASGLVLDADGLLAVGMELLGGPFEDEPLQYGDYAAWQSELLEESPPAASAPDEPAPASLPLAGTPGDGRDESIVPVTFDAELAAAVSGLAAEPRDAWLAVWAVLAARLTGRQDVQLAVAVSGRASDEIEGAVGIYARSIPVAVDLAPDTTFAQAVTLVSDARIAAETAQEQLGARPLSAPLAFAFSPAPAVPDDLGVRSVRRTSDPFGGQARLEVTADGADVTVELVTDVNVGAGESDRIAGHLVQLARTASIAPDAAVWGLDTIPAADREALAGELGTGPSRPPAALVHERFAEQAARTPDAPAVVSAEVTLTYGELAERADAITAALRARGATGGTIALLLDRSPDLIAAVLGVLKAGAAYLPLNPDQPEARLAFQMRDAGATIVLTDDGLREIAAGLPGEMLSVSDTSATAASDDESAAVDRDDVAYLIYTSGSTGVPKGVEVTHGNLANYVDAVSERLDLDTAGAPLHFGLVTTLSTDLGNTSVFPALTSGGCLELVPVEAAMDGAEYAGYVTDHPIDVLKITPSHLSALLASGDERVLPRARLVLGGEAAPWKLVDAVRAAGTCTVLNHYGPTETTVGSLTNAVGDRTAAQAVATTLPIGTPLANTTVSVVDEQLRLVPLGVPGELLIGGAGVTRGYRNQPEQTAEQFIVDPVRGAEAGRVYRTGDQVRMLADGSIEFLNRVDGQLKIRGFRVEVAEVEAVLREHASVGRVAVVPREDQPGDVRLVAYVVPAGGAEIVADALRSHARQSLPEYMVPSAVVALDDLPLMPNGKLDRAALPAPDEAVASAEFVASTTPTEEQIAAIWAEALGVERVGVQDDFFELGGHSLLATQVIARIRSAFGVQLPLHTLFTAPRIAELASEVDVLMATNGETDEELGELLAELEGLSDEEVERLLATEGSSPETG